jgi:hypothetical protein
MTDVSRDMQQSMTQSIKNITASGFEIDKKIIGGLTSGKASPEEMEKLKQELSNAGNELLSADNAGREAVSQEDIERTISNQKNIIDAWKRAHNVPTSANDVLKVTRRSVDQKFLESFDSVNETFDPVYDAPSPERSESNIIPFVNETRDVITKEPDPVWKSEEEKFQDLFNNPEEEFN